MQHPTRNILCRHIYSLLAALALLPLALSAQTVRVAVMSINDFHGGFLADTRKDIPGAPAIWATLDSLRQVYPASITVAAGDNFGGSHFYNTTEGRILPDLFNRMGITISTLGNHEFDDGQAKLADRWSQWRPAQWDITYVCANVTDNQGVIPSYITPCTATSVPLPEGGEVRIGFVGLLTSNTPNQVSSKRVEGLNFNGNYTDVVKNLKKTKTYEPVREADIRLLLMHVGTKMDGDQPVWDDRDGANIAAFDDPDFHGMLTGHTHETVCGRINERNYPVVQGKWHGEYIGLIVYEIDAKSKKILNSEAKLVHVNPNIALQDKHRQLADYYNNLLHSTKFAGYSLDEPLTTCTENLVHDRNINKFTQTEMGQMVCEAYAEAVRTAGHMTDATPVIGVSHFGSIRCGFSQGEIRVLEAGEALPFGNSLRVFKLKGSQIKKLVEFGLNNRKYGTMQTGNLEIDTTKTGEVAQLVYISPRGVKVKLKDNNTYNLVADSFQSGGGDDYNKDFFPEAQEMKFRDLPTSTQAFIRYLQARSSVPSNSRPKFKLFKKLSFKKW